MDLTIMDNDFFTPELNHKDIRSSLFWISNIVNCERYRWIFLIHFGVYMSTLGLEIKWILKVEKMLFVFWDTSYISIWLRADILLEL